MLKKSVSILLVFLLLCGIFTAVPLTVYADGDDRQRGRDEGYSCAESDWYGGGHYASSPSESENEDFCSGWYDGYDSHWGELESETPGEDDYLVGYNDGRDAAQSDWDTGEYTSCPEGVSGSYQDGWNIGYSERWSELEAENPVEEHTYDEGYADGYAEAERDYPDSYDASCPHEGEEGYGEYCSGWSDGYSDYWNSQQPSDFDGIYVTSNGAVYAFDSVEKVLTFVSGTFDGGFFENEFDTNARIDNSADEPIYQVTAISLSEDYPEMVQVFTDAGLSTDPVSFSGDCGSMFSAEKYASHFYNCSSMDLSKVDTSGVTDMSGMFEGCGNLETLNISGWDTGSVTSMSGMFTNCRGLGSINVSHFDTSNVTDMSMMFAMCRIEVLDCSNFNTEKVKDFTGMFAMCDWLIFLDISSFTLDAVENSGLIQSQPGTFLMFYNSDDICNLTVPSDFKISDDMTLWNHNGGWVLVDGDGTKLSEDCTVDLSFMHWGEYNAAAIPRLDESSKAPVMYVPAMPELNDRGLYFFAGHSLTLEGDIGVNFYVDLGNYWIPDSMGDIWKVVFEWEGKSGAKTSYQTLSGQNIVEIEGKRYYKATCWVSAAEMTSNIHAYIEYMGHSATDWVYDDYCVRDYGETIINAPAGTYDNQDNLVVLAKEMLNYGAKAQLVFGVNTTDLANKNVAGYTMRSVDAETISASVPDMEAGLNTVGLKYYAPSVVFLTKNTLRQYYVVDNPSAFEGVAVTFNGESVGYKTNGDTIYFEVSNIPASKLDVKQTLKIGNLTYEYSVLDFARRLVEKGNGNQKALGKAVYWYNQAAKAYFGNSI